jgi:hypothetical protein
MGKLCEFLVLNIFMYSFIYAGFFLSKLLNCIGIKAKAAVLQLQYNSNACIGLHNAPIHTAAGVRKQRFSMSI